MRKSSGKMIVMAVTDMLTRPRIRRRLPPTLSGSAAGVPACCWCNRMGSCMRCVCMKAGRSCVNCLPWCLEKCQNLPYSPPFIPSMPALPADNGTTRPSPNIHLPVTSIDALPPLHSILCVRTPTLRYIPKSLRDAWATVVGEVLTLLLASPNQIELWYKLFMLPSPPRGGCSHWRDVLSLVQSQIQKWRDGRISELWANMNIRGQEAQSPLVTL